MTKKIASTFIFNFLIIIVSLAENSILHELLFLGVILVLVFIIFYIISINWTYDFLNTVRRNTKYIFKLRVVQQKYYNFFFRLVAKLLVKDSNYLNKSSLLKLKNTVIRRKLLLENNCSKQLFIRSYFINRLNILLSTYFIRISLNKKFFISNFNLK